MTNLLIDQYGRKHSYLRISVTDRCNLRCVYCMPADGLEWKPREEILTYEEIIRLAKLFVSLGVDKIRITGGEPTVRQDLEQLIGQLSQIKGLNFLALTTNGVFLKRKAPLFRQHGLQGINISLDTLRPERFTRITRRNNLDEVLQGIEAALEAGFDPIKINMVVMSGINNDEIMDFVQFAKDKPVNVRFIEFMPFKNNGWSDQGLVPYANMREQIQSHYSLIPILTEPSAVAKDFAIPGFKGTVSFITSMTENFCGTCNRIRLTADGSIKSCLFHPAEESIRDLMRQGATDHQLSQLILDTLYRKPQGHAPMHDLADSGNRSMILIGG